MLERVLNARLDTLFQDQNMKSNTLHAVIVKKRWFLIVFSLDTDEELNTRLRTIAFIQWEQK